MMCIKRLVLSLLVVFCTASILATSGCQVADKVAEVTDEVSSAVAQAIEGDVTGEVGKEYATKWFTFSIDTLSIESEYDGYDAEEGYLLLVAQITETNTYGESQPFGTFDWFVDDDSLYDYIYPLEPFSSSMMPESFDLEDGESATYDVVIEYPADLVSPFLMYREADENGDTYTTFRIPIE